MLWREVQRKNFTNLPALLDFLEIEQALRGQISARPEFPLNLPLRLAQKIEKNCIEDPIFRQFVPLIDEQEPTPGFGVDPVGDCQMRKGDKLLQKYAGRALLVTTSACAMHCRYCFRQHFDYAPPSSFREELELVRSDTSLSELILSGGDPLSLSDATLRALFHELSQIEHIKLLRIHTRFPIGIPERINDSFLELLANVKQQVVFVIHCNHPKELDADVISALKKIQRLGIPLLNQSVLLKGVNDSAEILKELSLSLISVGVIPYYLHQLDRVHGAAHFEVEENEGLRLIAALQEQLPGYGVPKYVREIAGEKSKTPLLEDISVMSVL